MNDVKNDHESTSPHEGGLARPQGSRLRRLAKKELVEILRDRRTIITLVLMPLLVYPLLGVIVQKFLLRSALQQPGEAVFVAAVADEEDLALFEQYLTWGSRLLSATSRDEDDDADKGQQKNADGVEGSDDKGASNGRDADNRQATDGEASEGEPQGTNPGDQPSADEEDDGLQHFHILPITDQPLEDLIAAGAADIGIRIANREELQRPSRRRIRPVEFEILFRDESVTSLAALHFVQERLHAVNEVGLAQLLRLPDLRLLAHMKTRPVAARSARSSTTLLAFIPLMLVLMTMTGAVYPAIDLTAGERERGTMEILVAAPVSRMALLFGKFVAVLTVAMLTAIINMLAMLITLYTLGLEAIIFGQDGLDAVTIATIFGLLLVFAGFFSAVLLGLTSFARSFKEAQAYLIPIMLLAMAPGVLSLIPNIEMTAALALVPLVNIVLLGRDVLSGEFDLPLIAITIISTVLYALLALGMAARVFGTDLVLVGGSESWSEFLRRSLVRTPTPSLPTAMFFMAVLFPLFIVASGLSSRIEASVQTRLWMNAGITFALFVLLPLGFSRVFQLKSKSTFLMYRPRKLAVLGAVLVGLGAWAFIYELEVWSLSSERMESMRRIFESVKEDLARTPLWVKLVCLAITPAVCEEFTFRGFMMSAFRAHTRPWIAVLSTAVLFGLFHVFVRDALLFERMLPSTLMGVLLGWVCLRTGSVYPGMILHAIHNGLLVSLAHYEQALIDWQIGINEQEHLPALWLVVATVLVVAGIGILLTRPVRARKSWMVEGS